MDWFESIWESLSDQSPLWWWIFVASAVVFVVSPVVAGWLVARLPSDYFTKRNERRPPWQPKNPALRIALIVAKNLLGVVLLIAGVVMLLTPGQGLLSIVMGLVLVDFPGKHRLQRWLILRKPVWRTINWLRRRAGRAELERPQKF